MAITLDAPLTADQVEAYLLTLVPTYYRASRYYRAHLHANSVEFSAMAADLTDILTNKFPTIALEWGLRRWEALLDLPVAPNLTFDQRRQAILIKLLSVGTPSKPDIVRSILDAFGINASIFEPDSELLYLSERGGLSNDGHLIDYNYWSMNVIDVTVKGSPTGLDAWLDHNVPAGIKWWMTRLLETLVTLPRDIEVRGDVVRIFESLVDLNQGMKPSQRGTLSDEPYYLSAQRQTQTAYTRITETLIYDRELLLAGSEDILAGDTDYTAGQVALAGDTVVWTGVVSSEI